MPTGTAVKASTQDNSAGTPVAQATSEVTGSGALQTMVQEGNKSTYSEAARPNLTIADAPTGGDMTRSGSGFGQFVIPNPTTVPTVAVTGGGATGGLLQAGAYYLKYTDLNAAGETLASPESVQFTVAAGNIPQVTLPAVPNGGTKRNFYLTAAGGASGSETLYATQNPATGTTFNLSVAQASGAALPGSNTTGETLIDVGNALTGAVRATCDTASRTLSGRLALYDASGTPVFIGFSELFTFNSDSTRRLGNATGDFVATQRFLADLGAARKVKFFVESVSGGSWTVTTRPL